MRVLKKNVNNKIKTDKNNQLNVNAINSKIEEQEIQGRGHIKRMEDASLTRTMFETGDGKKTLQSR